MSIATLNGRITPRIRRLLGVVEAPMAALLVWAVAGPLAGITLEARTGAGGAVQQVGAAQVAVAATVAAVAAWLLRTALDRLPNGGRTAWLTVALIALAVSLLGPLGGTTMAATMVLASMHLVVAAVLVPTLGPNT